MSETVQYPRPDFEIREPVYHPHHGVGTIRVMREKGDPGEGEVYRVRVRFLRDRDDDKVRTVSPDDLVAFDPVADVSL